MIEDCSGAYVPSVLFFCGLSKPNKDYEKVPYIQGI
jgi:hypothetical protein